MNRCTKCDEPIDEDRIKEHLLRNQIPFEQWTCLKCSSTVQYFGVMAPSAEATGTGKSYGKTGQVLNLIPMDGTSHSKEMLRQAKRFIRRAR